MRCVGGGVREWNVLTKRKEGWLKDCRISAQRGKASVWVVPEPTYQPQASRLHNDNTTTQDPIWRDDRVPSLHAGMDDSGEGTRG